MNEWAAGYVADIDYLAEYYPELNPMNIRMAFLNAGFDYPEVKSACELGFGQGVSLNLHAAASNISWHGTDFNANQADFAQRLAAASGSGAVVSDASFAEYAQDPNLPDFDFIGLHGVWSWISAENRGVIVDFIRRKLKLGGVVYVSYNTTPAWSPFIPLRKLMMEHTQRFGGPGLGTTSNIDAAISFVERLVAADPAYFRANPHVAEKYEKMKIQNRAYLAHEYFNRDWHPIDFSAMADWLDGAKLSYVCPAGYMDHIIARTLTPAQEALLASIPDTVFRESVYDFIVNRQFRKDYWVKGGRRLAGHERMERLRATRVMLQPRQTSVPAVMKYDAILEVLSERQPLTLGQLEERLAPQGLNFGLIFQAAVYLCGSGHLAAVQDEPASPSVRQSTDKLNTHLLERSRHSDIVHQLANPTTGGGADVEHIHQLFLLGMRQGGAQPADWAQFALSALQAMGRMVMTKDGQAVNGQAESLAELTARAMSFQQVELPLLQAMHVV